MRFLLVTLTCLMAVSAMAQEAEEGPWSGSATLGFLSTSGNTESTSLNSGFELIYESGNWLHGLSGRAINSSQDDESIAEAYNLDWRTEYNFSETSYIVGRLDWRKDRFSGFDQQFSQTVAYGRRLIDTGNHLLAVEIGAGAKQFDAADGTDSSDAVARGYLDYTWSFSETASFQQEVLVESGDTNTLIESISALKARLLGDLALVASFTVRNNSDVPAGTEETDTFSALSLEYTF